MGNKTAIEWTDATWTPIRARVHEIQNDGSGKERIGWHCEHVSEGCRFCYAESFNHYRGTGRPFKPDEYHDPDPAKQHYRNGDVELFLDERMLLQPLKWKHPRKIFVGSMTDIFARFVPDEWLDRIFAIMALSPQHIFQVLTKRIERAQSYLSGENPLMRLHHEAAADISGPVAKIFSAWGNIYSLYLDAPLPLPNVWLGTSVEDQKTAEARLPILAKTPAAKRFVSYEPALGPVDFRNLHLGNGIFLDALTGWHHSEIKISGGFAGVPSNLSRIPILPAAVAPLDLVICGGESGPNARPMHPDWPRLTRNQCAAVFTPFFFKQWGEWQPACQGNGHVKARDVAIIMKNGNWNSAGPGDSVHQDHGTVTFNIGKKAAGALLDGVEHKAFPA